MQTVEYHLRDKAVSALTSKLSVSSDVMSCRVLGIYQRLEGNHCISLQKEIVVFKVTLQGNKK
jgi:hypothetical protein